MMNLKMYFAMAAFATVAALAQVPEPAPPQAGPILLVGGTAHIGDGTVVENAAIAFADGKITHVAEASASGLDRGGYTVVDISGQHVYPGMILPCIDLGLVEVGQVNATVDNDEQGVYNPNVRALIAYNTDSELIPTLRYNGVLLAQATPQGGVVSGTSSIMELDGWNWEDAAMVKDDAVHMSWPTRQVRQFDFATFTRVTRPNPRYKQTVQSLHKLFDDAKAYAADGQPDHVNLKLEAVQGLFDGSKALFVYADQARAILEGVGFAKKKGVKRIVLVGGHDALQVAGFLKEHDIPIVLGDVHDLPSRNHEDIDIAFKKPTLLRDAGLLFCLGYEGRMSSRNLPFFAGTAAAYGLGKEDALKAVTLNAAKILGVDDRVGSLTVGKHATLFVSRGDALDMLGNDLSHAFIRGKALELPGMQQRLWDRFKRKYDGE